MRGERPRTASVIRNWPCNRRAAEQGDELAAFHLIDLHSILASQVGSQNIELARISQEVTERF
jgi:hypothetical protein